jgi:hypothetical protein
MHNFQQLTVLKRRSVLCLWDTSLCSGMPETSPVKITEIPCLRAVAATASICSKGQIDPPPMLCVFSTHSSFTGEDVLISLASQSRGKRRTSLLDQEISLSLHLGVVRVFSGPSLEPPIALRRIT